MKEDSECCLVFYAPSLEIFHKYVILYTFYVKDIDVPYTFYILILYIYVKMPEKLLGLNGDIVIYSYQIVEDEKWGYPLEHHIMIYLILHERYVTGNAYFPLFYCL